MVLYRLHRKYYNESKLKIINMEDMVMIAWIKINHFTGEPYKRSNGGWQIVDYISGDMRISELPNGDRMLTKGKEIIGTYKTLKQAKAIAESSLMSL